MRRFERKHLFAENRFMKRYTSFQSRRASFWNYGTSTIYFITINVKNHAHKFGTVHDDVMVLSSQGKVVQLDIDNMMATATDFIILEHVIMPNHLHFLIQLNASSKSDENQKSLGGFAGEKNPMLTHSISKCIRDFKGRTTFKIRKIDPFFQWQPNYHDHIVRSESEFARIRRYIINNPIKWPEDRYYLP